MGEAEARQASQQLPSADDIEDLLWPAPRDMAVVHVQKDSPAPDTQQVLETSAGAGGTAGISVAPTEADSPTRRTRLLQTHQKSLLDRAAAKRALAALLAAAKASQIRGWSPRMRPQSPSPPASVRASPGLPSLEDIEALVPIKESRLEPDQFLCVICSC